jgi:hypothetical protein
MKKYYECHVTMLGDPKEIRPLVEQTKWKFSAIDGDPVLGDGIKCYATMFYNNKMHEIDVLKRLEGTADYLEIMGVKVIRRKVELVIYDDKSSTVQCNGACPCCHLEDYTHK